MSQENLNYQESLGIVLDKMYQLIAEFKESEWSNYLQEKEKEHLEEIVIDFSEIMLSDFEEEPSDWTVEALEKCCLQIMPNRGGFWDNNIVQNVLLNFFDFMKDEKGFGNIGTLIEHLEELNFQDILFDENYEDSFNFGLEEDEDEFSGKKSKKSDKKDRMDGEESGKMKKDKKSKIKQMRKFKYNN